MKRVLLICMFIFGGIQGFASADDLDKSKGTDQDTIVSLTPVPKSTVSQNTKIEAVFTIPLDTKHLKKHDIKLKCLSDKKKDKDKKKCKKEIKGVTDYIEAEKKVIFTPKSPLTPGLYEVKIKDLKTDKAYKKTKIKEIKYRFMVIEELPDTIAPVITLNGKTAVTLFQDGNYVELGATATDERDGDVNVTISGSVDTNVLGNYTVIYSAADKVGNSTSIDRVVTVAVPKLISLSLESNATTLNVEEKTALIVMGTYEDNSSKVLTSNLEWIVNPSNSVQIDDTILTALKDTQVTLQAKVDNTRSAVLSLDIYWEVNGHRLPPEPDKATNDATLLGIDVNSNDVRDDVERWIYETYKDKHPIHIDIAMQAGRAYKQVLETPERAKEIHDFVSAPLDCELYYRYCVDDVNINEKRILGEDEEIIGKYFRKKIYFDTEERERAYLKYDKLLSGDSYTIPWCSESKQLCDFNTSKYEE